jgi:hypothetical protein
MEELLTYEEMKKNYLEMVKKREKFYDNSQDDFYVYQKKAKEANKNIELVEKSIDEEIAWKESEDQMNLCSIL